MTITALKTFGVLLALMASAGVVAGDERPIELFDGKTLDGGRQRGHHSFMPTGRLSSNISVPFSVINGYQKGLGLKSSPRSGVVELPDESLELQLGWVVLIDHRPPLAADPIQIERTMVRGENALNVLLVLRAHRDQFEQK
jgi:hypothetical protein